MEFYYFILSKNSKNAGGVSSQYDCPSKCSFSVNNEQILTKFGNGFNNIIILANLCLLHINPI
jgi:hypothetical protein